MRIITVTPAAVEPFTLSEIKSYLRVDSTDDDALITSLIAAGREWCETFTRRALISRVVDLVMDSFPGVTAATPNRELFLPLGRATAVASITYTDADGVSQTLTGPTSSPAGTEYQEDLSDPYGGLLVPAYDDDWPDTRGVLNAVKVRFTAGYGAASTDIPAQLLDAMRFRIASMYEARGEQDLKQWIGVDEALARPYQIRWFG